MSPDPAAVQVRSATEADLPAIKAITDLAIARTVAHFGTEPWPLDQVQAAFRAAGPRHPWLVAVRGDTVLGYAKTGPWSTRAAYDWTVDITVYLHPDERARGVGRALYEALMPRLRAADVRTVIAAIALPNPASVALHEAFGFRRTGTLEQAGWKHGAWIDVGYWVAHLGDRSPPGPPAGAATSGAR